VCLPIPPLPQFFLLNQSLVEAGEGPSNAGGPTSASHPDQPVGTNHVTVTGPTPATSHSENREQKTEN